MKFDDLVFDKYGCCSTHPWAEVRHSNGLRSDVQTNEEGGYTVATFGGAVLYVGAQTYGTHAGVEARLASDAALSV